MNDKKAAGHLTALITIIIWGTTFISTKLLLESFKPAEILFLRFVIGFLALISVCPKRLPKTTSRQELTLVAAGLCGICLYYLLENIALTYTMASNVGVIISIAPFFTAVITHIFMKDDEKLRANFFAGFTVAIIGICMISFNGSKMRFDPAGDLLAAAAAIVWACYSVLTKKIGTFGYNTILTTRRVFAYGVLFMIPSLFLFDCRISLAKLTDPACLGNLLFLGLGASALCFVTWNIAVRTLGAVKTSVYIYLVPVITVAASALILHEMITVISAAGTVLTMLGLVISQYRGRRL